MSWKWEPKPLLEDSIAAVLSDIEARAKNVRKEHPYEARALQLRVDKARELIGLKA